MLLTSRQFEQLKYSPQTICLGCGLRTRKNYCRNHDEFFWDGHTEKCHSNDASAHAHCRTYTEALNGGPLPKTLSDYLKEAEQNP